MHRDAKLGLAMAILVIGFAAALCFPREDLKDQPDLNLESAAVLDAEIGLTNSKLYAPREPEPAEPPIGDAEEVLPVEPVPTPIEPMTAGSDVEPTPINPATFPADRIEKAPAVESEPEKEPEPVQHTRSYRIQYGDTLTGIALREMGTTNYGELLRVNRDRISDPNNLKPGTELLIPIPEGTSDLSDGEPPAGRAVEPDIPGKVPTVRTPEPRPRAIPRAQTSKRFSSVPR